MTMGLKPFVEKLGHKKRRQMCPLYVAGLIGPGERKSIEPRHKARFNVMGLMRLCRLSELESAAQTSQLCLCQIA
jgi:SRSO17 transposase